MAGLQSDNLSAIAYEIGNTLFTYRTTDAIATVIADDYFGPIAKDRQMRVGDTIIATTSTGGTVAIDLLTIIGVDHDAEEVDTTNGT